MSEKEQPKKHDKRGVIAFLIFFLLWINFIVFFIFNGFLHNHWLMFLVIFGAIWIGFFKLVRLVMSKDFHADIGKDNTEDISSRITNDICTGIAPQGYWWNSSSTTTHTHDPYISTTTYTSTNRDY